ncbi:MAG: hypothetical protein LBT48_08300 [Prevotellaceae bacterium]|jgi:hypothetical protein|nr:hypothetical protein [Prevotellaceae bacterium]
MKNIENITYDKAKWHFSSDKFPADLPAENGYTHIAFFLRWCIEKDFHEPTEFDEEALSKIPLIKNGAFDCRKFFIDYLDGSLVSCVLNVAGQEFAAQYYNHWKHKKPRALKNWTFFYLDDFYYYQKTKKMTYTKVHQKGAFYSVENTEHNYQAIKKLIDRRYKIFLDMKSGKIGNKNFFVGINWDFFKCKKK